MATNFPTSLQDMDATRGSANQPLNNPSHVTHHQLEDDTIEALQAKVGIDNSAVTTSLDYLLKSTSSTSPGHKHVSSEITDLSPISSSTGVVDGGKLVKLNASGKLDETFVSNTNIVTNKITSAIAGEDLVAGNAVFITDDYQPYGRILPIAQSLVDSVYSGFDSAQTNNLYAQSFTVGNFDIKISQMAFCRNDLGGSVGYTQVYAYLYAVDGSGKPTGSPIVSATITNYWENGFGGNLDKFWFNFTEVTLTANTTYCFVWRIQTSDLDNYDITGDSSNTPTYVWVSTDSGSSWTADTGRKGMYVEFYGKTGTADRVYKASALNPYTSVVSGFALSNVSSGSSVTILTDGVYETSGLTIGSYYLSDTSGAISTSAGTNNIYIGEAISATQLQIKKSKRFNTFISYSGNTLIPFDGFLFGQLSGNSNIRVFDGLNASSTNSTTLVVNIEHDGDSGTGSDDSGLAAPFCIPVKAGQMCNTSGTLVRLL